MSNMEPKVLAKSDLKILGKEFTFKYFECYKLAKNESLPIEIRRKAVTRMFYFRELIEGLNDLIEFQEIYYPIVLVYG